MVGAQETALLDAVMKAAVDAIVVSDARGRILRTNPAADQIFQYQTGELIGQNVAALMPDAMADLHDSFMTNFQETGKKRIIGIGRDVEGMRRDGSVFPVHLSVGNTEFEGQVLFVAILHDLSARKATQAALTRSQRLDAIGQMTGGISHDFNNLLTVIIGNLELLEMRSDDEKMKARIADALEAAELGVDLTSRLKAFARKSDLRPEATDLRDVCHAALGLLERTFGANYVIETEFAEDVHLANIDPTLLQSALVNMAMNARDAMPNSGRLVLGLENIEIDDAYIAQEADVLPGSYVKLSISDNGQGMTQEAQKRAFEPFYTTKSEHGGTGLGLAMVHGFVRQSGGHITLYSEPGLGTSFSLYFPAISPTDETHGQRQVTPILAQGQGQHVLVVEDNPLVLRLSLERVRDLGFRTHRASSGDEALALLQSGLKVDLVFSDVVMPGRLNGFDLAAEIEAQFPEIKILLTSGYASDVMSRTLSHESNHDILHKPYRQADLARRMLTLLEES